MSRYVFPGLRPTTLLGYLASLGLFRVLSEQADPLATCFWERETFALETSVDSISSFLTDIYVPTPVVSPWNGGSGYGEKDVSSRAVLKLLTQGDCERLDGFRTAHSIASRIVKEAKEARWSKARLTGELRNWLPDESVRWLDAAVVLTGDGTTQFPPLLGTGGNDGRLDFSTNFHQRLVELLPELGASRARSMELAEDLLEGTQVAPLAKAAAGQYDPLGAGGPGSSATDSADSLVNPWAYVLMVEGALLFAASPVKRMGESGSRASIPFTVMGSAAGPIPGAIGEESRGEIWAPLWDNPRSVKEIHHVFAQAKASWDGSAARRSAQMYAAARSAGVDQRVSRLVRFGLLQRNGLAFTAVRLDVVDVSTEPGVDLLIPIEHRVRAFTHSVTNLTGRLVAARRALEDARVCFAREVSPEALVTLLVALTEIESVVANSHSGRELVTRAEAKPQAVDVVSFLSDQFSHDPALRIGASLASARCLVPGEGEVSLGRLLLGEAPTRHQAQWLEPLADGFGARSFVDALAGAVQWLAVHPTVGAPVGRGFVVATGHRVRVPWRDVHQWVRNPAMDSDVERSFRAFAALAWDPASYVTTQPGHVEAIIPVPTLAVLGAFASGQVMALGGVLGEPRDRVGLDRSWPARLAAGADAVRAVDTEACERLGRQLFVGVPAELVRRFGPESHSKAVSYRVEPMTVPPDGTRLLAALAVGASGSALSRVARPVSARNSQDLPQSTPTQGA